MRKYKYVFTRKYPFIKKQELSYLEQVHTQYEELHNIIPIILIILTIVKFIVMMRRIKNWMFHYQ